LEFLLSSSTNVAECLEAHCRPASQSTKAHGETSSRSKSMGPTVELHHRAELLWKGKGQIDIPLQDLQRPSLGVFSLIKCIENHLSFVITLSTCEKNTIQLKVYSRILSTTNL
jgi:hypothetical protein